MDTEFDSSEPQVLGFGNLVWDVFNTPQGRICRAGGCAANTVQRLARGAFSCVLFGTLGSDFVAKAYRKAWRGGALFALEEYGRSASCVYELGAGAQACARLRFAYGGPSGSKILASLEDYLKLKGCPAASLRDKEKIFYLDAFILQRLDEDALVLLRSLLKKLYSQGFCICLDLGHSWVSKFYKTFIASILCYCFAVFGTKNEWEVLGFAPCNSKDLEGAENQALRLAALGASDTLAIIKSGDQGAEICRLEEGIFSMQRLGLAPRNSLSTFSVGAGDNLAAGFIAYILKHGTKNLKLEEALRQGMDWAEEHLLENASGLL